MWFSFFITWEQRKAYNVADYSKGCGYSKSDLKEFGTPIILYGRLYTKYQFIISEVDTFVVPKSGSYYSQGNEVIIPASGETAEDIARASAVGISGVLLGGDLNILHPYDFINPAFLALAISNGVAQKELAKKAQGKSVVHIHNSDIQEVPIAYPLRIEQEQIVGMFRNLDNLITLHQRKQNWQNLRFLRKISSLILAIAWEQRKLGEEVEITMGQSPDGSTYRETPAEYILVQGNADLKDGWVFPRVWTTQKTKTAEAGDLIMSVRAPAGAMGKTAYNVVLGRGVAAIKGSEFIFQTLVKMDSDGYWKKLAAGSTFESINSDTVSNAIISIPQQDDEQNKIGALFESIDNLITLHQCEEILIHNEYGSSSLSRLQYKMANAWEQRKLGDIGKTYGGLSGKSKEDFGHGGARFVTYMNVFSNPVGDPGMTEAIELDGRQNEVKKGDIFFTTSSETPEEVGMSCVWMENMPNTYLNSFCFGYRPIVELDLYYLAYVLRSSTVRHKFIFLAQGISRYNISKNKAMEMLIPVPNMEEQVLLGAFFKNFDNLITLHQCKRAAFMSRKSPSIFQFEKRRNTLTWEQRKLGELCEKFADGDWIEAKDQSSSGIRLIQTGNIGLGEYLDKPNNKKWVSEDTFNRLHCEEVFAGDILVSRLPEPAGRACIVPNLGTKMITAVDCTIVRTSAKVSKKFLLQHLSSKKYFDEVNTCMAGGTRQRISRSNLANFNVLIPTSFDEQESIGRVLCGLDNLITLHQRGENIYNRRQTW